MERTLEVSRGIAMIILTEKAADKFREIARGLDSGKEKMMRVSYRGLG
jgi:hypothetical protein